MKKLDTKTLEALYDLVCGDSGHPYRSIKRFLMFDMK